MTGKTIEITLTVADVLQRWPQTIPVFLRLHTSCVGCAMASFETLGDVARNYGLSTDEFLQQLDNSLEPSATDGQGSDQKHEAPLI
jgi:hybrid cluster-associated redox disulfide protein